MPSSTEVIGKATRPPTDPSDVARGLAFHSLTSDGILTFKVPQKGKRKSDVVEEDEEASSSKRQKSAKSGRQPMWTILPYSRLSESQKRTLRGDDLQLAPEAPRRVGDKRLLRIMRGESGSKTSATNYQKDVMRFFARRTETVDKQNMADADWNEMLSKMTSRNALWSESINHTLSDRARTNIKNLKAAMLKDGSFINKKVIGAKGPRREKSAEDQVDETF